MTIAFISRATIYSAPGGDTTQMEETAASLRRLGVSVDIFLTSQEIDYSRYDLLHFFNIIRPADILRHTRRTDKPYVISTIFVEYGNLPGESLLKRSLHGLFGEDRLEYIKVLARRLKNREKIGSMIYLFSGHRKAIERAAGRAALLLPNSESEYQRFTKRYTVNRPYRVIPNGINVSEVTAIYPDAPKYHNAVLCMARIEPIKNQLALIRAMRGSDIPLFIHGKPSPNHASYFEACREAAAGDPNIHMGGWLAAPELYAAYASARVHVLPSYFETTGLSSLEAAAMGCNIVVTDRGDTKDYFGKDAWYCHPDQDEDIRRAVLEAHAAPFNPAFRERILRDYTWTRAAEETLKAYEEVLRHNG